MRSCWCQGSICSTAVCLRQKNTQEEQSQTQCHSWTAGLIRTLSLEWVMTQIPPNRRVEPEESIWESLPTPISVHTKAPPEPSSPFTNLSPTRATHCSQSTSWHCRKRHSKEPLPTETRFWITPLKREAKTEADRQHISLSSGHITGPVFCVICLGKEIRVKNHKNLYSTRGMVVYYRSHSSWKLSISSWWNGSVLFLFFFPLEDDLCSKQSQHTPHFQGLCFSNSSRYFLLLQTPYLMKHS